MMIVGLRLFLIQLSFYSTNIPIILIALVFYKINNNTQHTGTELLCQPKQRKGQINTQGLK